MDVVQVITIRDLSFRVSSVIRAKIPSLILSDAPPVHLHITSVC